MEDINTPRGDTKTIKVIGTADLPIQLLQNKQAPTKLYARGDTSLLYGYECKKRKTAEFKLLCVVGSRQYTPYGKEACEALISGLRGHPVVIVSGLALGIDGIAHRAALDAGLKTIGVPGSGLSDDVMYPATNQRTAEDILEAGGCLISEWPADIRARPFHFPQRNRIMAGLSHAVLVIEAEQPSGTLITSRLAQDYNRDVFVVPGSIFSSHSAGPHMLLSKGAIPVTCAEEILDALDLKNGPAQETKKKSASPRGAEKTQNANLFDATEPLTDTEHTLLKALTSPRTRDQLLETLRWDIRKLNITLSLLEFKDLIKNVAGEFRRM